MKRLIIIISVFILGISCYSLESEDYICTYPCLSRSDDNCCDTAYVHFLIGESTAEGRGYQDSVFYGGTPNVEIWQDKSGTANDEFQVLQLSNNMGTTLPSNTFFGAEMEFAKLIQEQSTCCPTYIIKYGRGGRKLCDYWLNGGAGENLIANGIPSAMAAIQSEHSVVVAKSVFWLQGINDSKDLQCSNDYETNANAFYDNVNNAIGQVPKWIIVRNHDELDNHPFNSTVQTAQTTFSNTVGATLIDGNIWQISADNVHYTTQGNIDKGTTWFNNQ